VLFHPVAVRGRVPGPFRRQDPVRFGLVSDQIGQRVHTGRFPGQVRRRHDVLRFVGRLGRLPRRGDRRSADVVRE